MSKDSYLILFVLIAIQTGFVVSHNADKLLQDTCHLSVCQK